jgi:hypothetical protein
MVKAEASQMKWESSHKSLVEKKASTAAAAVAAKKATTVSASGAVAAAPPKPKTYADMSVSELDAWLKANVL